MLQGGEGRGPPTDGTAGTSDGDGGGGGSGGGGRGRDRISDLPDKMRHHIFSFMPAWEVVRTSMLSRRWRNIWASAPCLDIHYPCGCVDGPNAGQDWYAQFVKHLLLKRSLFEPLDTLRLHWNHDDANTWIEHALRRNARHIELSGDQHRPRLRPKYWIFLYGNLKILHLSHLEMNNNPLSQLCSRCTSLEELELKNVYIYASHIQSTSLKRLTMVRCVNRCGLSVDAPNLVYLRCIRPHNFVPRIVDSCYLLTATIMLDDTCLTSRLAPCRSCANDENPVHGESQSASDDSRPEDSDSEDPGHSESQSASDDSRPEGSDAEVLGHSESQSASDDSRPEGSDSGDPGHSESQSASDDSRPEGSDAENLGHSESQAGPDDNRSADAEDLRDTESQSEPAADSSAVSDAEHPDNNDDDAEIADVYSGDDDDYDDDEIADVYSSEDDCYGTPTRGGHGILRSLSNVITLNLRAHYGQLLLFNEIKNCPEFRNLRTLSLGEWCTDPGFDSLSTMLGKSPNLENLFIHLPAYSNPRERSFTCNNLRVKISYSMSDGRLAHQLETFLCANYGSREKRKVQDEAASSPAK
ncbi:uncharacterized protein [Lolium perenne]|uniref:uncharacterized protein n=1 Tax=Lolium perenne TaxID=4522 RepID=UPI0021F61D03|nr:uncharacterized protein LOC127314778 [Lolium perenne]